MPTALQLGHKGWKKYIKRQNHPAVFSLTTEQMNERNLLLNRVREAARRLKEQGICFPSADIPDIASKT